MGTRKARRRRRASAAARKAGLTQRSSPPPPRPSRVRAGMVAVAAAVGVAVTLGFLTRTVIDWRDGRAMEAAPLCTGANISDGDCLLLVAGTLDGPHVRHLRKSPDEIHWYFSPASAADARSLGGRHEVEVSSATSDALQTTTSAHGVYWHRSLVAFTSDRTGFLPSLEYGSTPWLRDLLASAFVGLMSWFGVHGARAKRRLAGSWWGPAPRVGKVPSFGGWRGHLAIGLFFGLLPGILAVSQGAGPVPTLGVTAVAWAVVTTLMALTARRRGRSTGAEQASAAAFSP